MDLESAAELEVGDDSYRKFTMLSSTSLTEGLNTFSVLLYSILLSFVHCHQIKIYNNRSSMQPTGEDTNNLSITTREVIHQLRLTALGESAVQLSSSYSIVIKD